MHIIKQYNCIMKSVNYTDKNQDTDVNCYFRPRGFSANILVRESTKYCRAPAFLGRELRSKLEQNSMELCGKERRTAQPP